MPWCFAFVGDSCNLPLNRFFTGGEIDKTKTPKLIA